LVASNTDSHHRRHAGASNASSLAPLLTLTYRSRAVTPPTELELYRLLRAAQARNHEEGLTGLLVYDNGCFLQTLEGPQAGLDRVWASIQRDPRHTGIELLCDHPTASRFFPDWDLKLMRPGAAGRAAAPAEFELPPALIGSLQQDPAAAPAVLSTLALVPLVPMLPFPHVEAGPPASEAELRVLLHGLVAQWVVPPLVARHAPAHLQRHMPLPPPHPRVAELTDLLVAAQPAAAERLVGTLFAREASFGALCASVFEPVARSLAELWQADACGDHEMTLALCRLQAAIRHFSLGAQRHIGPGLPAVLVVPQPGELHLLGAALDAGMLWRSGWDMHAEFPATDAALDALLADTWFDALDLTLSISFRREHWLPRLASTIAHARAASLNPKLVVVVGGRAFSAGEDEGEADHSAAALGDDGRSSSANNVEATILHALRRLR